MAVDKYQAAVAEGRKTHAQAMETTERNTLSQGTEYDAIMNGVLEVVEEVGREEALLAEEAGAFLLRGTTTPPGPPALQLSGGIDAGSASRKAFIGSVFASA